MKLTKFEHACFVVEDNGRKVVVDPGAYTTDFVVPDNVSAIVITHNHADHLNKDLLVEIIAKNPEAIIVGHQETVGDLHDHKLQTVTANEGIDIDGFKLEFYGGKHATIDPAIPIIANLGIMINGKLYYPGDSFTLPERPVEILALPVAAPWMKLSEAVSFLKQVKPQLAFPTHDAILSDAGKGLPDNLIPLLTKDLGIKYQRLHEPLEI